MGNSNSIIPHHSEDEDIRDISRKYHIIRTEIETMSIYELIETDFIQQLRELLFDIEDFYVRYPNMTEEAGDFINNIRNSVIQLLQPTFENEIIDFSNIREYI